MRICIRENLCYLCQSLCLFNVLMTFLVFRNFPITDLILNEEVKQFYNPEIHGKLFCVEKKQFERILSQNLNVVSIRMCPGRELSDNLLICLHSLEVHITGPSQTSSITTNFEYTTQSWTFDFIVTELGEYQLNITYMGYQLDESPYYFVVEKNRFKEKLNWCRNNSLVDGTIGRWINQTWEPFSCTLKQYKSITACEVIQKKEIDGIIFFGDSILRTVFQGFYKLLMEKTISDEEILKELGKNMEACEKKGKGKLNDLCHGVNGYEIKTCFNGSLILKYIPMWKFESNLDLQKEIEEKFDGLQNNKKEKKLLVIHHFVRGDYYDNYMTDSQRIKTKEEMEKNFRAILSQLRDYLTQAHKNRIFYIWKQNYSPNPTCDWDPKLYNSSNLFPRIQFSESKMASTFRKLNIPILSPNKMFISFPKSDNTPINDYFIPQLLLNFLDGDNLWE